MQRVFTGAGGVATFGVFGQSFCWRNEPLNPPIDVQSITYTREKEFGLETYQCGYAHPTGQSANLKEIRC